MKETKSVVNLIKDVIAAMSVTGITNLNYEPGASVQIIESLVRKDQSKTLKDTKFPLIAMLTPVSVSRGEDGFYGKVRIPVITIATYSTLTMPVLDRFADGGTFQSILYPVYYEFLRQLSYNELVVTEDDGEFRHKVEEDPGVEKITNTSDFVDCLNIRDLEFYIIQKVNC